MGRAQLSVMKRVVAEFGACIFHTDALCQGTTVQAPNRAKLKCYGWMQNIE